MWKFTNDRPVYLQIVDEIISRIAGGVYKPGERIPSVRELAEEARVTPNTMQRALAEVERSGYIISLRTSGKFVTDDSEAVAQLSSTRLDKLVADFAAELGKMGVPVSEAVKMLEEYDRERNRDQ